jgi:hypothetical protein
MRNVLKVVEKIKAHILCSISFFFFRKSHRLWDNAEKYCGYRRTKNDVTIWHIRVDWHISRATCTYAHAHALGYPHARARVRTHRPIFNTYCFSTAMVSWRRLNVTLCVHCLSCLNLRTFRSSNKNGQRASSKRGKAVGDFDDPRLINNSPYVILTPSVPKD